MTWFPDKLMTKTLTNPKMWAQHVKQFLVLTCDIETKSQGDMHGQGGKRTFYNDRVLSLIENFDG